MKKMLKKIKNRAGLTLTEMLVTVAILSLFSAACLTGMTTALSVRRDNIMANDAEILASMVTNYITNELRTASNIDFRTDGQVTYQSNESGFKSVTLKLNNDGRLVMDINGSSKTTVEVFSEAAYSDKSVKQLKIINLTFEKFEKKDDKSVSTMKVTFGVGYDNADGVGDPVRLATADTDFTVGLMNDDSSA